MRFRFGFLQTAAKYYETKLLYIPSTDSVVIAIKFAVKFLAGLFAALVRAVHCIPLIFCLQPLSRQCRYQ